MASILLLRYVVEGLQTVCHLVFAMLCYAMAYADWVILRTFQSQIILFPLNSLIQEENKSKCYRVT